MNGAGICLVPIPAQRSAIPVVSPETTHVRYAAATGNILHNVADAIIEIRQSSSAINETKVYHVTAIGIRFSDTR